MKVNHEVKGMLAKCLATENIIIEHRKVSTASFNVHQRVLTLPMWNNASSTVYDLLCAHEVGHARATPDIDWTESYPDVPQDFVNVVEDARVEKIMKRLYPGLSKTFYQGYNELNEEDFFSTKDENLNKLSLIDRINLYFKIGAFHNIEFSDEENEFLSRISKAETFDEVLKISKDLADFVKHKKEEEVSSKNSSQMSNEENSSEQMDSNSNDSEENQQDSKLNENHSFNQSEDKSGEKKDDNQMNRSVSKMDSSNSKESENGNDASKEVKKDELKSKTSESFDEKSKKLNDDYVNEVSYVELPNIYLDKVVIPNSWIHSKCSDFYNHQSTNISWMSEALKKCDNDYLDFKKSAEKEVSYLVKEFECKKSADQYARSSTARTGILDTTKLHTYKYSEDLFKKISIVPDGKNHGLVFILDWSGSMQNWILDTCKQLFNLIWFCRKVNIPFEVYAFTLDCSAYIELQPNHPPTFEKVPGVLSLENSFRLMNFFTSKVNNRVLEEQLKNVWRSAYALQMGRSISYPSHMGLSGSPIGESIMCLHKIIPQFQRENKLQKVNVIFLTDGEGFVNSSTKQINRPNSIIDIGSTKYQETVIRDRKTGRVYPSFDYCSFSKYSKILLQTVKDNYPSVNLINFRVSRTYDFNSCWSWYGRDTYGDFTEAKRIFTKQNYITFVKTGFDQFNVIPTNTLSQNESFDVDEGASKTKIKSAFTKLLNKKKTNRKLLSSFVDMIS